MRTIISVSKKKKKNNRSLLLSALMKQLGGETGDSLANAFAGSDPEAFRSKMDSVVSKLVEKMPNASV